MDEAPPDNEPLLVADDHGAWDIIEDGISNPAITVQQLIKQDPDNVIGYIARKGVAKLGNSKCRSDTVAIMMSGCSRKHVYDVEHVSDSTPAGR